MSDMVRVIRWIPVAERMPSEREVVVVFQGESGVHGGRVFAGFRHTDDSGTACWYGHPVGLDGLPTWEVAECGDVRATDFWLPLPQEPPDHNCFDGGWPG